MRGEIQQWVLRSRHCMGGSLKVKNYCKVTNNLELIHLSIEEFAHSPLDVGAAGKPWEGKRADQ